MKHLSNIPALRILLLGWICGITPGFSQDGGSPVTYESITANKNAELEKFINRKKALEQQPAGKQRDLQVKQEIQRHLAETKKLAVQEQSLRTKTVTDLKHKWDNVKKDWQAECEKHQTIQQELESLPENAPDRQAKIDAESTRHRTESKKIATDRNVVHEGVMEQANREVTGGSKGVSNEMKQTAGTKVNDPNHQGMNGDCDAGGGYRTTEKAAKILDEIGVKTPAGETVKIKNGVLETSGDFGLTVNADPGLDSVGSSGNQAQVKQGAAHKETYVSEQAGAVKSQTLKDHLATLDHTKKANYGLNENPETLVGPSPKAQSMVKGAAKAAGSANLPPATLEEIALKNGFKDSESMLDRMAEIKTGNGTIKDTGEAKKLQQAARDLIDASTSTTQAKAQTHIDETKMKVLELEAQGKMAEAQKLRNEVADYTAKAKASTDELAHTEKPGTTAGKEPAPESPTGEKPTTPTKSEVATEGTGTKPNEPNKTTAATEKPVTGTGKEPVPTSEAPAGKKPGATSATESAVAAEGAGSKLKVPNEPMTKPGSIPGTEPEVPKAGGGKLMQGAGWLLGAYGIYEGYYTACAEMEAKKKDESKNPPSWTSNKMELAGRTLWHGLGFSGMAEIGKQAGKDSYEQYQKDIASGKVSPKSWASYGWMKTRAVLGGLYGGVKAMTYDTVNKTGESLGEAAGEGEATGYAISDWYKNVQNEKQNAEWKSKKVYDTLIKNGASTVGAQLAADGVLQGDFTEAKRLSKILDEKQAAKLAASPKTPDHIAAKIAADPSKTKPDLTKTVPDKDDVNIKPVDPDKITLKTDTTKVPADPSKAKPDLTKTVPGKEDVKTKLDDKNKNNPKDDAAKLAAAALQKKQDEAKAKALQEDKAKTIALLREAIAKTRSSIAQLEALGGGTAELEAILATMNARYAQLIGGPLKMDPKGSNGKPNAKIDTPLEGGKVTYADGSTSVLTYGKDAAGNKVPITTYYDNKGNLLKKTTVNSSGKTVPKR